MKKIVIAHPDMGVFLGAMWGLGFWSNLDPVGQSAACAFDDEKAAREFVAKWGVPVIAELTFHEVDAYEVRPGQWGASIDACVKAGLPRWETGFTDHGPSLHEGTSCVGPMQ